MRKWKKVISVTLCFLLLCAFVIPPKKSEAVAPAFAIPLKAIPAGVKISAGAKALGGAVLAGVVTGAVIHYSDIDIVEKAQEIWDGLSTAVKNGWENLFNRFWESKSDTIEMDESFMNSFGEDLAMAYLRSHVGLVAGEAQIGWRPTGAFDYLARLDFPNYDYFFLVVDGDYFEFHRRLDVGIESSSSTTGRYQLSLPSHSRGSVKSSGIVYGMNPGNWDYLRESVFVNTRAIVEFVNENKEAGPVISVVPRSVRETFYTLLTNIYDSDFPLVGANAIYYPLSGIYPYAESLGKDYPLVWNPDIEAFVLPSNPAVPYQGNIGWYVPVPTTYVDTNDNVRVGYRSADGTITDALTGEIIGEGVGEQPIPGEIDVPAGFFDTVLDGLGSLVSGVGNIVNLLSTLVEWLTTGLIGDIGAIRWDKIMNLGYDLTNKFPFSIPWDIKRAFDAVFANVPVADFPVWEFKVNFLGNSYTFLISFPEYVLNWFPIIRTFILVLFDVGIALSIRQWLGGAS